VATPLSQAVGAKVQALGAGQVFGGVGAGGAVLNPVVPLAFALATNVFGNEPQRRVLFTREIERPYELLQGYFEAGYDPRSGTFRPPAEANVGVLSRSFTPLLGGASNASRLVSQGQAIGAPSAALEEILPKLEGQGASQGFQQQVAQAVLERNAAIDANRIIYGEPAIARPGYEDLLEGFGLESVSADDILERYGFLDPQAAPAAQAQGVADLGDLGGSLGSTFSGGGGGALAAPPPSSPLPLGALLLGGAALVALVLLLR